MPSVANGRIGLGLLGAPEVPNMVARARLAEAQGFESVWVAETRLMRDAMVPCAAILLGTQRIKVATGIINVYTRGVVLAAASFVSLDEIGGERMIMGLGPGSPLVLEPQGFAFDKPVTRLREYVDVMQALLRGERVSFAGKTISVTGVELEAKPPRGHIPLYLGVTGPRALELAGEKADGVMLNAFLPTGYVERALERLEAGAKRAGRTLAEFDVAGGVVVSADPDAKRALDRARRFIALYLSLFPNIAKETALPDELLSDVREAYQTRGPAAAAELIDDDVVNQLTASGTVAQCQARLEQYRAVGMQLPIVFPLDPNAELVITGLR